MKFLTTLLLLLAILSSCTRSRSVTEHATTPQASGNTEVVFRQPSPYVQQFIGSDSIKLNSINHNSFRLYFKEGSYTSKNIPRIKSELDTAYTRILSVLDQQKYKHGIYLIAVDSEEEMEKLMGYHIKGGAAVGADLVFFVFNESIRPQFKHEIFHLISFETWGPSKHRLLDEGGATYTDNFCFYDNPMFAINAYFLKEQKLFKLKDLVYDFDSKAKESDVIAYIQSAGYFKYLYEKYGAAKMKQLWTGGFQQFENIYGFTIDDLEREWIKTIKEVPIPEGIDEDLLMTQGCG